jgi:hypothetical protein
MERITILANRLAEAILFDWDKEEVIKLAKEVAVACHENIEFVSLVKKMRDAQTIERKWGIVNFKTEEDKIACGEAIRRMYQLESEVDEYLKKMEE